METFIQRLIDNINLIIILVGVIAGLGYALIDAYKKLRAMWASKDLLEKAAPLSGIAATEPSRILSILNNKPAINDIKAITNVEKNALVSQALMETQPKLVKKVGLKTIADVGVWVANNYQSIIKPVIKAIKK